MTIVNRKTMGNQALSLISIINTRYESAISTSVQELNGGTPINVSS